MATSTTTTLLENLSEQQRERGSRSRRSSSRRSSGGSESSRSSISSTLSVCSSSSTESCGSSDGIVKGLTILGVCLLYAFMLFFIASVTTALSYVFRFRNKGAKVSVGQTVMTKSSHLALSNKLPVHKQG